LLFTAKGPKNHNTLQSEKAVGDAAIAKILFFVVDIPAWHGGNTDYWPWLCGISALGVDHITHYSIRNGFYDLTQYASKKEVEERRWAVGYSEQRLLRAARTYGYSQSTTVMLSGFVGFN